MLRPILVVLSLLAAPATAGSAVPAAPLQGFSPEIRPAIFATCTPKTVDITGRDRKQSRNPIADALGAAGPGSRIRLMPGNYPAFGIGYSKPQWWNAQTPGGLPGNPIVVEAQGDVRILPGDRGDTISIDQARSVAHITFRGLTIVPGYRAGVMFTKQKGNKKHVGFHFEDCWIKGSWNHALQKGAKSKWGIWGHSLDDFVFKGLRDPAKVTSLRYEHAFYLQNPAGSVLIENVEAYELGRTFVQLTNRKGDGPPGRGSFILRNCRVRDVGLSKDDNHKGGTAFTFAGRHTGTILVEDCHYKAGFVPQLRELTRPEVPYGTGALVAWDGHESVPMRTLVLKDNIFEFAPGCGDRAVVSIGGCANVHILGANRFVAGAHDHALALDPPESAPGGKPKSVPNKAVYIAPETELVGELVVRDREPTEEELASFAVEPRGGRKKTPSDAPSER